MEIEMENFNTIEIAKKKQAQRAMKYMSLAQKRVSLNWKKDEFENLIKPAIEKSGLPISTFIKLAVLEKLERDELFS